MTANPRLHPTQEHLFRLIGVRDGLAHALISISAVKNSMTGPANAYLPPNRHTRKRAAVLDKIKELDRAREMIQRQLDAVIHAIQSTKNTDQ